jgi:hypothetical protein
MHEIRIVIDTHPSDDGESSEQKIELQTMVNAEDLQIRSFTKAKAVAMVGEVATAQALNEFLWEIIELWGGGNAVYGDPVKVYRKVLEELQDAAALYVDRVYGVSESSPGRDAPATSETWREAYCRFLQEGGDTPQDVNPSSEE